MVRSELTGEVERYMVLPGQACAYKVGMLNILELRKRARAARAGGRTQVRPSSSHLHGTLSASIPFSFGSRAGGMCLAAVSEACNREGAVR
jgi:uncharacterized protein (DUF885 family)